MKLSSRATAGSCFKGVHVVLVLTDGKLSGIIERCLSRMYEVLRLCDYDATKTMRIYVYRLAEAFPRVVDVSGAFW